MKERFNFLGKISAYFIKNFRVVYLMLILICFLGVMSYNGLPREERPEMTSSSVRVTATYDGVPPEDMESLVTDEIEGALENVENIKSTSSTTSTGKTTIYVEFTEGYDMDDAVVEIESELSKLALPEDAEDPEIRYFNTVDMPIMDVTLSGDYTLVELKTYGEALQYELEQVSGVSEVTLTGGLDKVGVIMFFVSFSSL